MMNKYISISKTERVGGVLLDYQFTQLIKGLACLVIALHHYSQYVLSEGLSNSIIYFAFSTQGGDAGVALFFFLSGYGLMESETKHHLNLTQFVVKRFWKIYKGVLIINFLTLSSILCWEYFQTGIWSPIRWDLLFPIARLDFVLWFVKVLFTCYLAFTICTQVRNVEKRKILFVVGQLLVIGCWAITGQSFNHIVSIPFFAIGIYVSLYKEKVASIVQNKWFWFILLFIAIIVAYYTYKTHLAIIAHNYFDVLLIAFLLWVVSVWEIKLKYKSFLGYISFPVYLVHRKIIMLSAGFGHLAPVLLYIALTIYLGWILQKTMEISFINNGTNKIQ